MNYNEALCISIEMLLVLCHTGDLVNPLLVLPSPYMYIQLKSLVHIKGKRILFISLSIYGM